jgi:hypothetical protein
MLMMSTAQRLACNLLIEAGGPRRSAKAWTYLIGSLLDKKPELIGTLLPEGVARPGSAYDLWLQAQPVPPRKERRRTPGRSTIEAPTIDLAFGDVVARADTESGIEYGTGGKAGFVCFVESMFLSDCGSDSAKSPLRNHLAQTIENLLTFQGSGKLPGKTIFTLLTPRVFEIHRYARLYGYKYEEYRQFKNLDANLSECGVPRRQEPGWSYPANLAERFQTLSLHWSTYEDVLEAVYGLRGIDLMNPSRAFTDLLIDECRAIARADTVEEG